MSTPRFVSLSEIEAAIWIELARSVRDKQHAWRTPVLATTDGELGDARVVVLREASPDDKRLWVYTDHRSAKAAQLTAHPLGTLVMWSPALGWQLRCRLRMQMVDSGLAVSSRWARIQLTPAANDYLSPAAPGAVLQAPFSRQQGTVALPHFAVIEAAVESLDWVELHVDGHRRAVFDDKGYRWLQP